MSTAIIRPANQLDIPGMVKLWHEKMVLRQQFDRRCTLHGDGDAQWSQAAQVWLTDAHWCLRVAEREGGISGFIIGCVQPAPPGLSPEQYGLITDMTLDIHRYQGGLGRELLSTLREWFSTKDITSIIVSVPQRSAIEQAFWRSVGAQDWTQQLWMTL